MLASVADGADADDHRARLGPAQRLGHRPAAAAAPRGHPAAGGVPDRPQLAASHENLAFDRGALDFVDKARGVPILAKRLRLIVESSKRPSELEVDEILHCGRLMLKPRVSRAYWDEADINLTLTEFNIVRPAGLECRQPRNLSRGLRLHAPRRLHRGERREWLPNQCPLVASSGFETSSDAVDPEFAEIENYPSFGYRWGKTQGRPPA